MTSPLSARQIDAFRQDGYLVLKGWTPPAICQQMLALTNQHLQSAIPPVEYEAEVGYPGAPTSLQATGGLTIRRLRAAWQRAAQFRQWASNPSLVAILHQLFCEPVCITLAHHNCVMTKHPTFGSATGWHRDIRYWSFARNDLISAWLALGPENADNGGLKLIPGSHRLKLQTEQMDERDFLRPEVSANQILFKQGLALQLEQGDLLLFHSGLFHAAGQNASTQIKASLVFAYHGQSNQAITGTRSAASENIRLD